MLTLIDFYADWCGPCRVMIPILEDIEKQYAGKVTVKRVNVEEDPSAQQYNIFNIPTFVILKDGKEIDRKLGAMPKDIMTKWVDSHLQQ